MNRKGYETVVIVNPTLKDEEVKSVIDKFTDLINKEGKVYKAEDLGIKKLAYEIKNQKEGHYVLLEFESQPEFVHELERVYRITDEIMKFIVIGKELEYEQNNEEENAEDYTEEDSEEM